MQHSRDSFFLYDDGCALCATYTSTFSGLGWTGRQPFSTVDSAILSNLDLAQARHGIPLYNPITNSVSYGLDGVLAVVGKELPFMRQIVASRLVRKPLDAMYWMITYNRRHIVAAAPPSVGFDCAPDFNPTAVCTYIAVGSGLAGAGAIWSGIGLAALGVGVSSIGFVVGRNRAAGLNTAQALGHAVTITTAAVLSGIAVSALGGSTAIASTAAVLVGTRKAYLRRWIRGRSPALSG